MATLGAPQGIRGWVRVRSHTSPPENLLAYREFICLGKDSTESSKAEQYDTPPSLRVTDWRGEGQRIFARIEGCDSREAIAALVGSDLCVALEQLPNLEDDEFYWHELEGMTVIDTSGVVRGVVHKMMETGANDVMVVGSEASGKTEETLIPWLRPSVVKNVCRRTRRIEVDWQREGDS